jgi:hypothetical protein
VLIEQAVFTSDQTAAGSGYQLVARSPGVTDDQARELAIWGPSHDALNPQSRGQSSVNYHRLACGTCCVSKTVAAGEEYSGRGGPRIYTQFFLAPDALFARFSNNPFSILKAAWAKGILVVHDRPPEKLEPFTLAGRTPVVDEGLLAQWADQLGPDRAGRLVAGALSSGTKVVAGASNYETLFGGLLSCLPVECRTEVSFTTGLRYTPRRTFHLVPLAGDHPETHRAVRDPDITLIDLTDDCPDAELCGWAKYVAQCVRTDQLAALVTQLQQPRLGLTLDNLDQLGNELLEQLPNTGFAISAAPQASTHTPQPDKPHSTRLFRTDPPIRNHQAPAPVPSDFVCEIGDVLPSHALPVPSFTLTDGSHAAVDCKGNPITMELLQQLDEAVYTAVVGTSATSGNIAAAWKQLSTQLPTQAVSLVRSEYLRYALKLWHASDSGIRQPERAIDVLDLLDVLFCTE